MRFDLTSDQLYTYNIVMTIRSGNLPTDLARLDIGPVSDARWLTTTYRCRMWVSEHQLHESDYEKLKIIAEFIKGLYIPSWFVIKVKCNCIDGPWHISHNSLNVMRMGGAYGKKNFLGA